MSDATENDLPPFVVDMHCHAFNATDLPVYGFIVGFLRGARLGKSGFIPELVIEWLKDHLKAFADDLQGGVMTAERELFWLTECTPKRDNQNAVTDRFATLNLKARALTDRGPRVISKSALPALEQRAAVPALFSAAAQQWASPQAGGLSKGLMPLMVTSSDSSELNAEETVINRFVDGIEKDPDLAELVHEQLSIDAMASKKAENRTALKGLVHRLFQKVSETLLSWLHFVAALQTSRESNLQRMTMLSERVHLFVHSLIDMDIFAEGKRAVSPHADQVEVHEALAMKFARRRQSGNKLDPPIRVPSVHAFVGFTPAKPASLQVTKDAVEHRGFLGVKLYLNTGFWPSENRALQDDSTQGRDFDTRLHELYAWCSAAHVPILAHTGEFNAFGRKFRRCSHPSAWKEVLETYEGLRLCFGHFGLHDPPEGVEGKAWYLSVAELAAQRPGQCFFDLSNTDELKSKDLEVLRTVLNTDEGRHKQRLMYGSDYFMCELNKEPSDGYFERALSSAQAIDTTRQFVADYFGGNAMAFLGLRPNDRDREGDDGNHFRLERWYRKNDLDLPSWLVTAGNP